jgi:hypothetical protein
MIATEAIHRNYRACAGFSALRQSLRYAFALGLTVEAAYTRSDGIEPTISAAAK